jgi:hypothetical protein
MWSRSAGSREAARAISCDAQWLRKAVRTQGVSALHLMPRPSSSRAGVKGPKWELVSFFAQTRCK